MIASLRRRVLGVVALTTLLSALLLGKARFSASQGPQPAALFTAAAPVGSSLQARPNVIRSRFVRIDLQLLGAAKGQGNIERSPVLELELFDGTSFTALSDRVFSRAPGKLNWHGSVEGFPGSAVTFAVHQEAVAGTIHLGDELYEVVYAGKAVHEVRQLSLCQPMPEAPGRPAPLSKDSHRRMEADLADSGDVIDVMVVYTPASRVANGGTTGIVALIELAIAETNQAYVNSQINTQLNLVHTAEVDYAESGDMGTDLDRLTYTDTYMDEVHTWRNTYGADQVTLIEESSQYCGIGWVMQTESSTFQSYAFTVVASDCATGYYSYGHELGHNQGMQHDRANAGFQGVFPYSYGYWGPGYAWRTIMAYNCPVSCTRIQHFSNPDVLYGGQPTGIDYETDPANSADNARTLNETRDTFANFRQSVSSPPADPTGLSATAVSHTQIDLAWTDNANNETGTKIERSPDGSTNWSQIDTVGANVTGYSDTGLDASTWYYYRVRAYNGAGDSGYSNVDGDLTHEPPPPPAAPTGLSATAASDSQIDLAWTDNASDEEGFKIERSPDGSTGWAQIDTVGANVTSYSDTGLEASTWYYYRVRAYNTWGDSDYSNVDGDETDAPPPWIDQLANGEIAVSGTVSGVYTHTHSNDGTAQGITEVETDTNPAKNRYSYLQHKWTFDVQAGAAVTLRANVWAPVSNDGDSFVLAYSTDDANYVDMFTVLATSDDGSYESYALPADTTGTVYVRAVDTDHTAGHRALDTLYVDHLYIRTDYGPTAVELLSFTATAAKKSITLNWETASELDNLGFNLYRAEAIDGQRTRLNAQLMPPLVPPGSPFGARYEYVDEEKFLKRNVTYYYWLEDVDLYGWPGLHGPVSASLGK